MSSRRNSGRRAVFGAAALLLGLTFVGHFAGCGFSTEGTHPDLAGTPCTTALDCDDKNPCTDDACSDQKLCTNAPQTGGGPDDANPCTIDTCSDGAVSHVPQKDGTACDAGLSSGVCASGKCAVTCASNAVCDDMNACTTDSCDLGTKTCVHSQLSGPQPGVVPVKGDCSQAICDTGVPKTVNDDSDVPDAIDCKTATCSGGVLTVTDLPAAAACGADGKLKCDGSGVCGNCASASDCVVANVCQRAACISSACVTKNVGAGTIPPSLVVAGDCQTVACDGKGQPASQEDDTDVPADDGNTCTVEGCVAGAPVHDPVTMVDKPCATGVCNSAGKCVQCNEASECNDSSLCTTDACVEGACVHTVLTCNDQDPCTTDSCAPATGCFHTPASGAACNDNNACTDTDTCVNGSCVGTGKNCDDGNSCTTDACDTIAGCTHMLVGDGTTCGAGPACSGSKKAFTPGSTCSGGVCVPSAPQSCVDTNPCTDDSCSVPTGCTHTSTPGAVCMLASCSTSGFQAQPASTCSGAFVPQCITPPLVSCGPIYTCTAGACDNCADGMVNGNETDVDCGGGTPCSKCDLGKGCNNGGDCMSGNCNSPTMGSPSICMP